MKQLTIDTCTKSCSITLSEDEFILGSTFIHTKITHSETLLPMIISLLKQVRWTLEEVEAFIVSNGPGSFTGVRIGVSVVKGLCFGKDKKCLPISSLLGLAYQCLDVTGYVLPLMDARKQEYYTGLFRVSGGKVVREMEDDARSLQQVKEIIQGLDQQVYLVGDGAGICYPYFQENPQVHLVSPWIQYHHSQGLLLAANREYGPEDYLEAAQLLPEYIRLSQAETQWKEKGV